MAGIGRLTSALFGAVCLALLGYSHFMNDATEATIATASVAPIQPATATSQDIARPEPPTPSATTPSVSALTPAAIARLAEEAAGEDAGKRASAIDALAAAPEAEAVPILQKVLGSGGDMDRQLALSSLHALAVRQGDAGGAIRELLRQAIYDGGDEALASGAQVALEDLERDFDAADTTR